MPKSFKTGFGIANQEDYLKRYWNFMGNLEEGDLLKIQGIMANQLISCTGYIFNLNFINRSHNNRCVLLSFSISPTRPTLDTKVRINPDPFNGVLYIGDFNDYPITAYTLLEKNQTEKETYNYLMRRIYQRYVQRQF